MRLLVVNPNTSAGVTRRIDAAAQAAAHEGEMIRTVPAAFGPALIVTPEDAAHAMDGVLAAVEAHQAGMDGIILASFGDTGIEAVRARTTLPVAGIAHAAISRAVAYGRQFSIVSFSPQVSPSLREIVAHYQMAAHLRDVAVLADGQWSDPGAIQDELAAPLLRLCQDTAAAGGIGSIVLGGGPLAGLAQRFAPHVGLPLIDGTTEAVVQLRARLAATAPERSR
ncbi:aspartate/glutamate racemase family protein [Roseicitreum antarcticum]|uniref:Allantoin racemase n=1 Tax=Roseicitreum antarcticum TaxID=564137 RepID=A0A1H2XPU4_9RHOB|nr:aspartate/glutamate racemase family protein [Roseicitreum antarcticum]SDW94766.1 allantoin racemase [Roseicitreum antarcticum]